MPGPLEIHIDEGSGPLVVLLHGFPELPSSWRHQIRPLVAAGYHVVAPALRGYAGSPSPTAAAEYTADLLADDIAGVIEGVGETEAVVVGHDWGAAVTWATAQLRPERVRACVALSVPFTPRSQQPPIQRLTEIFGDTFFYMVYFQEPQTPDEELAADPRDTLLRIYVAISGTPLPGSLASQPASTRSFLAQLPPAELPGFLEATELEELAASFTEHGFTGPLNYYRAMDPSWHKLPALGTIAITCPTAFIAGERDPVLTFTPRAGMAPPLVTDLRVDVTVPGAGHWVQQEAPQETTRALLGFLGTLG